MLYVYHAQTVSVETIMIETKNEQVMDIGDKHNCPTVND